MLKLMKYEFRRQLFSKVVILGVLLALVVAFFGFYWQGVVPGIRMVLSVMGVVTIGVMLFAPIEHWFTFHKDIYSRQGYMTFLLPRKSTTIIGAKVLVSLLQTIVIYALFFNVVPFCERLAVNKCGVAAGYIGKVSNTIVETMLSANANVAPFIGVWMCLVVSVLLFSNLGLFIIAIPLQLGKLRGFTSVAGYIVMFTLIVFVNTKVKNLLLLINASPMVVDMFEIAYLVGINVALFFGTAKLLEKKISI